MGERGRGGGERPVGGTFARGSVSVRHLDRWLGEVNVYGARLSLSRSCVALAASHGLCLSCSCGFLALRVRKERGKTGGEEGRRERNSEEERRRLKKRRFSPPSLFSLLSVLFLSTGLS